MTWPNWLPIFALYAIRRLTPKISLIAFGSPLPIDAPEAFLWVTSWTLEFEAFRPDVFRFQTVIRLCQPLQRNPLLARQPCARQFFGNCPIRVDSRFCRAHPCTDKSRRCDSHSTLEGRTEFGPPFERRSPRSA